MTASLLPVVLLVIAAILGGSIVTLFAHGVWLAWRRRRNDRLLEPAREELNAVLIGGHHARASTGLASVRRLSPRLRARLVRELIPRLSGSARVRLAAGASDLGVIDHARRRLSSRLWWRRLEAARTLTPLDTDPAFFMPLLDDSHPAVRAQAVEWAGENPEPEVVDALLDMLPLSTAGVRTAIEDALLRAGAPAVEPLRDWLESHEGGDVLPALRLAQGLAQPPLLPAAIRLCRAESPAVRALAAELIGGIGGERGTAAVVALLDDSEPAVRAAAANALGRLCYWPAATAIAELLRDPEWDVRYAAGFALRALDSPGQLLLRRFRIDGDIFAADMARRVLDIPANDAGGGP